MLIKIFFDRYTRFLRGFVWYTAINAKLNAFGTAVLYKSFGNRI